MIEFLIKRNTVCILDAEILTAKKNHASLPHSSKFIGCDIVTCSQQAINRSVLAASACYSVLVTIMRKVCEDLKPLVKYTVSQKKFPPLNSL